MYLINTILGFLVMQLYDILRRQKPSPASPEKFSLVFFFRDTWKKIMVSLFLSITLSLIVHLNIQEVSDMFTGEFVVGDLIYLMIGAFPEWILQNLKKKYGVLQPDEVNGYQRKE